MRVRHALQQLHHGACLRGRRILRPALGADAGATPQAKAKAFTKKCPPDIVLYFDRLDVPNRSDFGDLPLLRTITNTFGAAVWFNAIVVLTHASTAPPDGPNGQAISYEMYITQRSHIVQQTIRQAAGDIRLMVRLPFVPGTACARMAADARASGTPQNPVALAENHVACRKNRAEEPVLPNGQARRLPRATRRGRA